MLVLCTWQASGKPKWTVGVRWGVSPTRMHVLQKRSLPPAGAVAATRSSRPTVLGDQSLA